MDVNNDGFFDEPIANEAPTSAFTAVQLPFPEKDFHKDGGLKKVRGRMLWKLLKCEFKFYLPLFCTVAALVLLTSVFYGVVQRTREPYEYSPLETSSLLLFIFSCMGAVGFMQVYPVVRYNKNFFQNEGYLTFSVPASVEEHVFAKRIAAVLSTIVMYVVVFLSIVIALSISGELGSDGEVSQIFFFNFEIKGWHVALYIFEVLVAGLVGLVLLLSAYGAISCLLSKFSEKKKTGTTILLVFIAVGLLESLLFSGSIVNLVDAMPKTVWGAHLLMWLFILLQAGLTALCICLEIWYLKKKLDLK